MNRIFRFDKAGQLSLLAIALFVILLIVLIPLLVLGLVGAAFAKLGFSWLEAVLVIVLMVIGYFINIPVWAIRNSGIPAGGGEPMVFDAFTGEPACTGMSSTTISLNIGGALIPVAVSVFLIHTLQEINPDPVFTAFAICLGVVALLVAVFTRVLQPWGIRAPLLFPSLAAISCGILLNGGTGLGAAVTAFSGGTMGILLGASAASLWKVKRGNLSHISIGGAGMFGPIFLCALLSALIA